MHPSFSLSLMTFPDQWHVAISLSRTPLIENYAWPLHTRENPVYYIFNAEGHDNPKVPKFGRGPMATSCAFWNDFLPRVRAWSGECLVLDDSMSVYLGGGKLSNRDNIFQFLNERNAPRPSTTFSHLGPCLPPVACGEYYRQH